MATLFNSEKYRTFARAYIPFSSTFGDRLGHFVQDLKTDYVSGAREMADKALDHLQVLLREAVFEVQNPFELLKIAVLVIQALSSARPAMSAAISAALVRCLKDFTELILIKLSTGTDPDMIRKSASVMCDYVSTIRSVRKREFLELGHHFAAWLATNFDVAKPVDILTLSNSSSIRQCILAALNAHRDLQLNLTILESRPRYEGSDMAAKLLAETRSQERLHITIAPDCAVGSVSEYTEVVLLGADRISRDGDVSNKIGSLAAALCATSHNGQDLKVVVASDIDKVIPGDRSYQHHNEEHEPEELTKAWSQELVKKLGDNVQVYGHWFEWVPAKYITDYCTERGMMTRDGISEVSGEIEAWTKEVFAEKNGDVDFTNIEQTPWTNRA
ncbi:nagb/rpia/CoA transferase-like protein [Delitschia confertaspora ATCC 74209]|uniref:Nagb/rpia/CoA transferase-like protein n=1 Tax=Delitschia confertaspora ATCC 74209 TaxID=1513339 RepID=A0A9P4JQ06_9PLEO|nr:nagb/rpia/CoA transferase-like protein [Delitschia confertaspora ATCC 74209]